jgi:hypothetical protein
MRSEVSASYWLFRPADETNQTVYVRQIKMLNRPKEPNPRLLQVIVVLPAASGLCLLPGKRPFSAPSRIFD